ncbi:unnamed protein product [Nippostrongylus brasiliensis]|uniref:WAPL domain-containing protein n=1 Tax=Nippostrongylus brasiliensis TaxID=27835 RepID=A0A0N4YQQ7_NIPBR|nr:unnamed protein product [Nippostrongylus brasiliensis]
MSTGADDILKNAQIAHHKELQFEDDLENLSLSVDDSIDSFRFNVPQCDSPLARMSTGADDILKNAQIANHKDLQFEDDLENLSLSVDDSIDSFRFNVPQCDSPLATEKGRSDRNDLLKSTLKSARDFIESDEFALISKDKLTFNGKREKLQIFCSTPKHVFDRVIRNIVQKRREVSSDKFGVGPAIHVCLAWLCHAAQCSMGDMVPGGEVFPHAESYIHRRLTKTELPEVPEGERVELAVLQVCRVLDLLTVCDLRSQSPVDRSILAFAICRLLLDANSCCAMQYRGSRALENILNASSLSKRTTLVEFSNIFPLLSDDVKNLQLCHEIIRESNADPSACLSLCSSTLIHLSERAECEPSELESLSDIDFVDSHLAVIVDVLEDVMDVCEKDDNKKGSIILMLDASLHPSLFEKMKPTRKQQITELLLRLRRELGGSCNPNGALTYRLLRNLIDRFEIQSNPELTITG